MKSLVTKNLAWYTSFFFFFSIAVSNFNNMSWVQLISQAFYVRISVQSS